ncbi:hypothetical protein D5041_02380 [Verminephrobacter aporrectodeae subsp. tuberculatae]|uniref:hypothetical protein n=1 Tax=Verminephrobacter aporrectodeae TaxID=1110389 RepID=UPI002238C768|nr:hypothetical protein [Verminephrobacter aporrectodeae]MCW5222483.1 hypothetical protein [Verminephrobacter aporrectodeae subsp. tuberculatae]MCW5287948.1 hypothetical protein [Verminephrobacter aporrectodeae subsp. tuberculatae]
MQGFLLALHATTPAALSAAVLLHLCAPAWLPPLAQRPAWAVWALISAWLLMSALAALALRPLALWRVPLRCAAAFLALAGALGLVRGAALAPAMLASLATLGLLCLGIAACIGPRRQARRVPASRRKTARRSWHQRCAQAVAHGPFWLTGLLALESLRLAHLVSTGPARASGMLGLLLAFFIALPAATLRVWAARSAGVLWSLAALAYGGLALKTGLLQWPVAAALCAIAACHAAAAPVHPRQAGP